MLRSSVPVSGRNCTKLPPASHSNHGVNRTRASQTSIECAQFLQDNVISSGRDTSTSAAFAAACSSPLRGASHGHAGAQRPPASIDARFLTSLISSATTVSDLVSIRTQYSGCMNHIHLSALLCKLAKLSLSEYVQLEFDVAEGLGSATQSVPASRLANGHSKHMHHVPASWHGSTELPTANMHQLLPTTTCNPTSPYSLNGSGPASLTVATHVALGGLEHPVNSYTQPLTTDPTSSRQQFNGITSSSSLSGLPSKTASSLSLVHDVLLQLQACLHSCTFREISNSIWSLVKLQHPHTHFITHALEHALQTKKHLQAAPHEISTVAWALAKSQHIPKHLLYSLKTVIYLQLHQFDAQSLSNLSWAYVKSGTHDRKLLDALAVATMQHSRPDTFLPQHLATIAWSFATARYRHTKLFHFLASLAKPIICRFSPQPLSMLAWAIAAAGHDDTQLLSCIAASLTSSGQSPNTQQISNVAWACAKLKTPNLHSIIAALLHTGSSQLVFFTPTGLAVMLWAAGTASALSLPICNNYFEAAALKVPSMSPLDVALLAWACARSPSQPDTSLLNQIAQHVQSAPLAAFKPSHIAMLAWSYSLVKHPHQQLMTRVTSHLQQHCQQYRPREVATTLWALLQLQSLSHNAVVNHVVNADSSHKRPRIVGRPLGTPWLTNSLLDHIAPAILSLLPHCNAEELAKIASVYSAASPFNHAVLNGIAAEAFSRPMCFSSLSLVNLSNAYFSLRLDPPGLWPSLSHHITLCAKYSTPAVLSQLVHQLTQFMRITPTVAVHVSRMMLSQHNNAGLTVWANLSWCVAAAIVRESGCASDAVGQKSSTRSVSNPELQRESRNMPGPVSDVSSVRSNSVVSDASLGRESRSMLGADPAVLSHALLSTTGISAVSSLSHSQPVQPPADNAVHCLPASGPDLSLYSQYSPEGPTASPAPITVHTHLKSHANGCSSGPSVTFRDRSSSSSSHSSISPVNSLPQSTDMSGGVPASHVMQSAHANDVSQPSHASHMAPPSHAVLDAESRPSTQSDTTALPFDSRSGTAANKMGGNVLLTTASADAVEPPDSIERVRVDEKIQITTSMDSVIAGESLNGNGGGVNDGNSFTAMADQHCVADQNSGGISTGEEVRGGMSTDTLGSNKGEQAGERDADSVGSDDMMAVMGAVDSASAESDAANAAVSQSDLTAALSNLLNVAAMASRALQHSSLPEAACEQLYTANSVAWVCMGRNMLGGREVGEDVYMSCRQAWAQSQSKAFLSKESFRAEVLDITQGLVKAGRLGPAARAHSGTCLDAIMSSGALNVGSSNRPVVMSGQAIDVTSIAAVTNSSAAAATNCRLSGSGGAADLLLHGALPSGDVRAAAALHGTSSVQHTLHGSLLDDWLQYMDVGVVMVDSVENNAAVAVPADDLADAAGSARVNTTLGADRVHSTADAAPVDCAVDAVGSTSVQMSSKAEHRDAAADDACGLQQIKGRKSLHMADDGPAENVYNRLLQIMEGSAAYVALNKGDTSCAGYEGMSESEFMREEGSERESLCPSPESSTSWVVRRVAVQLLTDDDCTQDEVPKPMAGAEVAAWHWERAGWEVVRCAWWQWQACETREDKQQLLLGLLGR